MFRRLPRLAVVLALSCTIGLHWTFFQSLAWVGMVVNYSQTSSLKQALTKTFDGKHPCKLCKQIAKGKQSEKKSTAQLDLKKLEFLPAQAGFNCIPPTHCWFVPATLVTADSVFEGPPVPPPRSVIV